MRTFTKVWYTCYTWVRASIKEEKALSHKLRQVRLQAALTIQEISLKSGISRTTIEKAEKGKEAINTISATKIVRALNELAGTTYTPESLDIYVSD